MLVPVNRWPLVSGEKWGSIIIFRLHELLKPKVGSYCVMLIYGKTAGERLRSISIDPSFLQGQ